MAARESNVEETWTLSSGSFLKTKVTPSRREMTSTTIALSLRLERLNVMGTIKGVDANKIGGVVRISEVAVGVRCRRGLTCFKREGQEDFSMKIRNIFRYHRRNDFMNQDTNLDFSLQTN